MILERRNVFLYMIFLFFFINFREIIHDESDEDEGIISHFDETIFHVSLSQESILRLTFLVKMIAPTLCSYLNFVTLLQDFEPDEHVKTSYIKSHLKRCTDQQVENILNRFKFMAVIRNCDDFHDDCVQAPSRPVTRLLQEVQKYVVFQSK